MIDDTILFTTIW